MSDQGINYQRLYEYRSKDVDQVRRQLVWNEIAGYLFDLLGRPGRVLDPAGGRCEFINAVPATERWVIDAVDTAMFRAAGVKGMVADARTAELPSEYFDGIFVSNFLEHLHTQDEVAAFLSNMRQSMATSGSIAVMGPNFKYCSRDYFDCADHTLVLTHVSVAEHLYAAGFDVTMIQPRFLPFSFRGLLPPSPALTRIYLQCRPLWTLLGKQFLVMGRKVT